MRVARGGIAVNNKADDVEDCHYHQKTMLRCQSSLAIVWVADNSSEASEYPMVFAELEYIGVAEVLTRCSPNTVTFKCCNPA